MKRNNDSSFRFRMVVNMMASFNPIQYKSLLFECFDNLLSISVNLSQIATEHVVFSEGVNTTLSCIVINI